MPIARTSLAAAIALMAFSGTALPARASGTMDLDALDHAVAAFTGAPAGSAGGAAHPADRRLRLADCPVGALAVSWRSERRDTVLVQCTVPGGWRLFFPVLKAGSAAFPGHAPATIPVVQRGDAVTIEARGSGFVVSQPGQAMEPGGVGDWVKVRLAGKKDPVTGRIARKGLVEIP